MTAEYKVDGSVAVITLNNPPVNGLGLSTRRGIVEGARVTVASGVGEIAVEARGSDALMPGVACLPHGFGHDRPGTRQSRAGTVAGASYNDLTDALALDQPSGNAALNGLEVTVRPA